jgi:hypothetical protein
MNLIIQKIPNSPSEYYRLQLNTYQFNKNIHAGMTCYLSKVIDDKQIAGRFELAIKVYLAFYLDIFEQ